MKIRVFLIEQQAIQPTEYTDVDLIASGVEGLNPTTNSYYVVNKPNGDYIQFAGSTNRLVAEFRAYKDDDKFTHYVIGYDIASGLVDKVECLVGPLRVNQNQVLNSSDAKQLIHAFCNNAPWPNRFRLSDVTEMFL